MVESPGRLLLIGSRSTREVPGGEKRGKVMRGDDVRERPAGAPIHPAAGAGDETVERHGPVDDHLAWHCSHSAFGHVT
jgi:hypothetical protein